MCPTAAILPSNWKTSSQSNFLPLFRRTWGHFYSNANFDPRGLDTTCSTAVFLKAWYFFYTIKSLFSLQKFWAIICSGTSQRPRAQLFQCRSESFHPKIVTVDIWLTLRRRPTFTLGQNSNLWIKIEKKSDFWWKLPKFSRKKRTLEF